jgi:hypothetical protein
VLDTCRSQHAQDARAVDDKAHLRFPTVAAQFVFCPHYLSQAAAASNPVERLKLVVCCFVACLHTTSQFVKPFNPTLGETLQAKFAGGTDVRCAMPHHSNGQFAVHLHSSTVLYVSVVVGAPAGCACASLTCMYLDKSGCMHHERDKAL